jgi:DNA-binding MarR family transcriptional regulator
MVRQDISRPSDRSMLAAGATLDRVLELVERSKLSATELRVLLALLDRGACLADLAEALDQRHAEITRAGRSLSMRGLIRWHHVGRRKQTRLEITSSGLTTVRTLLTAAGAASATTDRPDAAAGAPAPESIRSRTPTAVAA